MAETSAENVKPTEINTQGQIPTRDLDIRSDTSEASSTEEKFRCFHYGYRSSNSSDDDDDEDDEEDPYQELFMNAYRSAPASSDEDESGKCTTLHSNIYPPEAKPLSLMEDWELWDSMDDCELKVQLKDHPILLEEITRKRKRKLLDDNNDASVNEDLSEMMNRFVKYIRRDPTDITS